MFDFAWSEIVLIGAVALLAIGPKDMPVAIKSVANLVKKARRMAGEFQTHVDDLMKEADLSEMRGHLGELRSFNLRDKVTRAIDPDGALRNTMTDTPLMRPSPASMPPASTPPASMPPDQVGEFVGVRPDYVIRAPGGMGGMGGTDVGAGPYGISSSAHSPPELTNVPAFIPPDAVAAERARRDAPAFIPPQDAQRGLARGSR